MKVPCRRFPDAARAKRFGREIAAAGHCRKIRGDSCCPSARAIGAIRRRTKSRCPCRPAVAVRIGDPLDEFPVVWREKFLLVRRADDEVNHLAQRARLLARARTRQKKLHSEAVTRRFFFVWFRFANDAQRGARRVEQGHRGRREPVFQFLNEFDFLLGFLGLGKTVEARVCLQFRRDGTFCAEKIKMQVLPNAFCRSRSTISATSSCLGNLCARAGAFQNNLRAGATSAASRDKLRNSSGFPRVRRRFPLSRKARGVSPRTRHRFATAPCGARRISSCPPAGCFRF